MMIRLTILAAVLLAAIDASADVVEQWTFDGVNPETGVNGLTNNKWTTASPNSVPSASILRYATPGNATTANFASPIDVSSIGQLILTADVSDFLIGTDPISSAKDQVIFQIGTDAGNLELELNVFNNNSFSPDLEQGTGSTGDLDIDDVLDFDDWVGSEVPLVMTSTWDFTNQTMSFETTGAVEVSASGPAPNLSNITSVNSFRTQGGPMDWGSFLDLNTVEIRTVPVSNPGPMLIVEESFESGTHPFANSGNSPQVVTAPDARSGAYVMKSQLTPASPDPERTEVSLLGQPEWNFDVGEEYWVGISTKIDEDFNDGLTFNDQGMLMQWHYRDWLYNDGQQPQPMVLRFTGDDVKVHSEVAGVGNLATGLDPAYGEWVDWVFHVKFADEGGIFEVWRDGEQVVDWTGDNHLTARPDGAYLKFGLYSAQYDPNAGSWHEAMPLGATRTVYHDELRIAGADGSYELVAPRGGILGDFNGDGAVDGRDFLEWQRNPGIGTLTDWEANYGSGQIGAATATVPEPASLLLVLLAASTRALFDSRSRLPGKK